MWGSITQYRRHAHGSVWERMVVVASQAPGHVVPQGCTSVVFPWMPACEDRYTLPRVPI